MLIFPHTTMETFSKPHQSNNGHPWEAKRPHEGSPFFPSSKMGNLTFSFSPFPEQVFDQHPPGLDSKQTSLAFRTDGFLPQSSMSTPLEILDKRFSDKVEQRFGKKASSSLSSHPNTLIDKIGWTLHDEKRSHELHSFRNPDERPPGCVSLPTSQRAISVSSPKDSAEEMLKLINEHQMNCVSLLNEICSKVKKKIDYQIKDLPDIKTKV